MRLLSLIALLLFAITSTNAQFGNIWYFGRNAGLNFNTFPPTAIKDGALNTYEGCASFSDINGRILFYTDGVTVYNKSHQIMQNGTGLLGDPSAAQSGIIVPWPGNDSLFFIFTADSYQNSFIDGNTYSVVNIKLNGGLGAVTTKNVRLYPEKCTEKITAVKHANGTDWWIITKEFGNNRFRAFAVTSAGVNPVPVVTNIGTAHSGQFNTGAGCMRASSDGKKLAVAIGSFSGSFSVSETNVFDFDNNTGVLSKFIKIPGIQPYGVEFSPDSRLLYVSYEPYSTSPLIGKIDQFNVTTSDSAQVVSSRNRITPDNFPGKPCGMQIAPDGKIYVVRESSFVMDVINSPNTQGVACGYQVSYIALSKQNGMMPPNIISSFLIPVQLNIQIDTAQFCDRIIKFTPTSNYSSILSYKWLFDDGDSSILTNPEKKFPFTKDTFNVSLSILVKVAAIGSVDSVIETKTAQVKIAFDPKPVARFTADAFCGNKNVVFKDSSTSTAQLNGVWWDYGNGTTSTNSADSYTYATYGAYPVKLVAMSLRGCPSDTARKTVIVKDKPIAAFADIALCRGVSGSFLNASTVSAPDNIVKYYWNFGDGGTSGLMAPVKSFLPGTYAVKLVVESDKGCISDTSLRNILVEDFPVANFGITGGCQNSAVSFSDSSTLSYGTITSWSWSLGNGNTSSVQNPIYSYSNFGDYTVQLSAVSKNGCASAPVSKPLRIEAIPVAAFNNTIACYGQTMIFTNNSTTSFGDIARYYWSFGDGSTASTTNTQHIFSTQGVMKTVLTATSKNGCASAPYSKSFSIYKMNLSAGNDTTQMLGVPFNLFGSGGYTYKWSPAFPINNDTLASPVATLHANQLFTLNATNIEGCAASAQVFVKVYKGPEIYVPTAFTPNNDGKNDLLKPVAAGIHFEYFKVFNRWGQLMFNSGITNKGWDGNLNGIPQATGTFVWMAKGTDDKGKVIATKGTVLLIR